ncbi:MAG: tryptophan-rich sensory protein, partial [Bacilli bacterium]|nr:tryptophan-rich sensory protein [Bacilli bacterium]
MSKVKIYVKSILIPVILGGIVGFLISGSMDYSSLEKPFLAPPSILFPIVWTILYILMGVSYGRLESKSLMDDKSKTIYYLQLFKNLLWPIFFFVFKWRLVSSSW